MGMPGRFKKMMRPAAGLFVFVLAFGANAWMLGLDFQNDDYAEIPSAGMKLGLEPFPGDLPWVDALRSQVYSYRPTLWAALRGLSLLSGDHANPWIFHLFFLSAHALASVLFYRILRARAGLIPGVIGAGLFAILPGGSQAVSWAAAGGDQLAVLFMLLAGLASDRVLRGRSPAALVAAGLAVSLAVLAKETAIVLLPALALLWVIPPGDAPATFGRRTGLVVAGAVAAGALAAWTLRACVLGTWLPMYWGGGWASPLSAIGLLPTAVRGFLIPWRAPGASPDLDPMTPRMLHGLGLGSEAAQTAFTILVSGAIALPVVWSFVIASTRPRLAVLAVLALGVIAILPVLPVTTDGLDASRALYPASLMLSALVASSACGVVGRNRRLLIMLAPFFAVSLDLFVHVARTERYVAEVIRTARKDLDGMLDRNDGARVVLIAPPDWIRSVPFLGWRFVGAACPPFGRARHVPVAWPNAETLMWFPAIREDPAPLEVIQWDGHHFVARYPILPGIPPVAPALEEDRIAPGTFRPVAAVPPRGIAGIRISLAAAAGEVSNGTATLVAGGRTRGIRFKTSGAGPHVMVVPDDAFDEAWFREPSLDSVRIDGPRVATPPVLLRTLPPIIVRRPEAGRLSLRSPPRISFQAEAPAAFFRVTIEFLVGAVQVAISWTVSATAAAAEGGAHEFIANGPGEVVSGGQVAAHLDWKEVEARLAPTAQGRLWLIHAGLRVEGLDASRNVIARSEWLPVFIVR